MPQLFVNFPVFSFAKYVDHLEELGLTLWSMVGGRVWCFEVVVEIFSLHQKATVY